ncbi:MAG: hypothetical protein N2Z80_04585 [Hydrogenothermaceae bacterium]|nr:hypothetical protein [Hydrogenothermaceae bacterium]
MIIGLYWEHLKKSLQGKSFWDEHYKDNKISGKKEGEKLCGFCFAKRKYHGKQFDSVAYFAIADYCAKMEIESLLEEYDIQLVFREDMEYKESLSEIIKSHGKPSKYYGLIMADGDGMGEKVDTAFKNGKIEDFTTELSGYSKKFTKITEKTKEV